MKAIVEPRKARTPSERKKQSWVGPPPARAGLAWTRTEDYFLKVRYQVKSVEWMAKALQRTPHAVAMRMSLMGFVLEEP